MLHMVSKDSNIKAVRELNIRAKGGPNLLRSRMLSLMGENKRLLNIHEQKFGELAPFQENTNVFQANTNASLKNLET